jgi:undecaprenyl-diphosphatase
MDQIIIFCAKYLFFLVVVLAFVYWLKLAKRQKIEMIVFGLITLAIAFVLAKLGGALFYDARPFVSDHLVSLFPYTADNGFPSDHTLFSAVIAVTVYATSKKWGLVLGGLAILVGISRVLAHVHHPVDIIGSLVIAVAAGLVAYFLTPKIIRFAKKQ